MRPRNPRTIICIGSALAYRSIPFQAPYCAAKAATRAFVDSLRSKLLWEGSKVRLTMVHLPAVNTPQFDWARNKFSHRLEPVPPIFQPETVAAAVMKAVTSTAGILARVSDRESHRSADARSGGRGPVFGKGRQGERDDPSTC